MRAVILLIISVLFVLIGATQPSSIERVSLIIVNEQQKPLAGCTVKLLQNDSITVAVSVSDIAGKVSFVKPGSGTYMLSITLAGYIPAYHEISVPGLEAETTIIKLTQLVSTMENVTIVAKKPVVQFLPDKTVVNVDASVTNTGANVLEVLEKSPGITVDRDGNISMKGKPSVMVLIDGKQTQLAGSDLQNLLSGMSASQVETIELIDNPGAKYDAAGNAGIINIRTKKNRQKGMNGSISVAYGQGRLPKGNSGFIFNFRQGSINTFLTYGLNRNESFVDVYALRRYFDANGNVELYLDQPFYNRGSSRTHNLRTGLDYFVNDKTTIGFVFTGTDLNRRGRGTSTANWINGNGVIDSTIVTNLKSTASLSQKGANLNSRHVFSKTSELSADFDAINYNILNNQYFENYLLGSAAPKEATTGNIPSTIDILSGKADYSKRFTNLLWEAGVKSSRVSTDNLADYRVFDNGTWVNDDNKSNHFLYTENIHAVYSSLDSKIGTWQLQGGIRMENTSYRARQLGNSVVKDSSFNRNYTSLFPTLFVSYKFDSSNQLTFRAGRRIDRPAFQKLNPFVIILNKYTLQSGNPYFRPQFTWNFDVSHIYRQAVTTNFNYTYTKDYFSQIFYSDTSTGLVTYTEGNAGSMQNFGLSVNLQLNLTKWWSATGMLVVNHKKIEGTLWRPYATSITQGSLNFNNQFRFGTNWGAELSGFYITRNQNDLQEALTPTGQISMGVSKTLLKNKATLRLALRDVFFTQAMAGLTDLEAVDEYFKMKRDTRVLTLSLSWRFGKAVKQPKRSGGGAVEEANRVGTVN